jgi:hypothetical protein
MNRILPTISRFCYLPNKNLYERKWWENFPNHFQPFSPLPILIYTYSFPKKSLFSSLAYTHFVVWAWMRHYSLRPLTDSTNSADCSFWTRSFPKEIPISVASSSSSQSAVSWPFPLLLSFLFNSRTWLNLCFPEAREKTQRHGYVWDGQLGLHVRTTLTLLIQTTWRMPPTDAFGT